MKKYFGLSNRYFLKYLEDTLKLLKLEFCETKNSNRKAFLVEKILQLRDFYDEIAYSKKA